MPSVAELRERMSGGAPARLAHGGLRGTADDLPDGDADPFAEFTLTPPKAKRTRSEVPSVRALSDKTGSVAAEHPREERDRLLAQLGRGSIQMPIGISANRVSSNPLQAARDTRLPRGGPDAKGQRQQRRQKLRTPRTRQSCPSVPTPQSSPGVIVAEPPPTRSQPRLTAENLAKADREARAAHRRAKIRGHVTPSSHGVTLPMPTTLPPHQPPRNRADHLTVRPLPPPDLDLGPGPVWWAGLEGSGVEQPVAEHHPPSERSVSPAERKSSRHDGWLDAPGVEERLPTRRSVSPGVGEVDLFNLDDTERGDGEVDCFKVQ
eukprot:Hpha_TRINITY_DN9983_c0_g1::TRINITY_DN9983_c0_g1_i1::g.140385::m.140385